MIFQNHKTIQQTPINQHKKKQYIKLTLIIKKIKATQMCGFYNMN